jgi:hypothetical protein
MRRKQSRQEAASNRKRGQPDGNTGSPGPAFHPSPDRFHANVFTWNGPGIENIFIDFEPARQRQRRAWWKGGDLSNPGESSEQADNNG